MDLHDFKLPGPSVMRSLFRGFPLRVILNFISAVYSKAPLAFLSGPDPHHR